jgi:hypothetical protein
MVDEVDELEVGVGSSCGDLDDPLRNLFAATPGTRASENDANTGHVRSSSVRGRTCERAPMTGRIDCRTVNVGR